MSEQPSPGLMQALAPVARRRPVHVIVSGAPGDLLSLVVQPLSMGGEETPELARGFSATATPEELDRDLPGMVAAGWVPAHQSLQSVVDQAAAHAAAAREETLRKQAGKTGKGKKDAPATAAAPLVAAPPAAAAQPAAATGDAVSSLFD